ncbi:hypothetical protein KM800_06700 [Clostridium tyrobutyricum]|uniref:tetratricopeptide repeat protein n=1 Tax=Clostridium tyrobutyricum TaxID=1519 RepID=UPI001C38A684|nr:hypothetical protein [Clostridium tyrobutyricum]MBV4419021.1 hypothetical protein [Clostridium tyrobutyricum]
MRFKGRFSLKTKSIIFYILSIIVIIIAVNKIIYNRKYNYNNMNDQIVKENSTTKSNLKYYENEKSKKLNQKYKEAEEMFRNKQYSNCIKKADEIIIEDKNFYKAYNIKGIALSYSGNFEKGMENIDKSIELNSNYGYAKFNKALTYELYGKYDQALLWYDKDLTIEKYVWSYYGKASIYGRRGDVTNTVKYLKIALDMSPEIKDTAKNEKDFDPVKNSKEFQQLFN